MCVGFPPATIAPRQWRGADPRVISYAADDDPGDPTPGDPGEPTQDSRRNAMALALTRRGFTRGGVALGLASGALARPAIADSEPIRIGWLAALTGPSSTPAIGFDRGVRYAVDKINAAGGVKGRMIELVTRDTQGDPTKAVNATQEMISREKVHAIWGPTNSGESLAVTAIMARAKMPSV